MITTVVHADTQYWLKIPNFVRPELRMRHGKFTASKGHYFVQQ